MCVCVCLCVCVCVLFFEKWICYLHGNSQSEAKDEAIPPDDSGVTKLQHTMVLRLTVLSIGCVHLCDTHKDMSYKYTHITRR